MDQNLKIAMLSIHSSPAGRLGTRDTGGMSVFTTETARMIAKSGNKVDIFSLATDLKTPEISELDNNVRLIHLNIGTRQPVAKEQLFIRSHEIFKAFVQFIADHHLKYDLIHSHYWLSGILGVRIQKTFKWPHLITFHTLGAIKNAACKEEHEPEIRIRNETSLIRSCNHIIAFTDEEKKQITRMEPTASGKIGIVPCGVNFEQFKSLDKNEARDKLDLSGTIPLLIFVGRPVPIKGLTRLLNAMKLVKRTMSVRLIIVGGPDTAYPDGLPLKRQIDRLDIADCVKTFGNIDHQKLALYYSAADATIVPSFHESFCLVALESLACGTPVIGSAVGGLPQIIMPGMGKVLDETNAQSLAHAIKAIIFNKRELLPGEQLRSKIAAYTWQQTAEKLIMIYKKNLVHKKDESIGI